MSITCKFCEIVQGNISGQTVYEDPVSMAFLDYRPLFPGHSLLVPKQHHETLMDLPPDLITALFLTARTLAQAMEEGLSAEGSFVAVNNRVSQSVAHFHIHVVPRRRKDGLRGFFWPRQKYKDEAEMARVAENVRSAVAQVLHAGHSAR
jgi:histidine triad (HIT) family protein